MEFQDDMAPGLDPAPARMSNEDYFRLAMRGASVYKGDLVKDLQRERSARLVQELLKSGWVDNPNQSNSAQTFVRLLAERHQITSDEVTMIPELLEIILRHNHDPHDTDLINTVIDLLDYIWNRVL